MNPEIARSPIFQKFIQDEAHQLLVKQYEEHPTEANKFALQGAYERFAKKAIAIVYIKKVLYYESRNFDKQLRKNNQREMLTLNQEVNEDALLIDLIETPHATFKPEQYSSKNLADHLVHSKLFHAVKKLTAKQREVLYYYYVEKLKDAEIAKCLEVTQQAVSKVRKQALIKIKESIYA